MSDISREDLMTELKNEWHLDRKVTLGIIFLLFGNMGSSIWWASRLDYTVKMHEQKIQESVLNIKEMRDRNNVVVERLARIEANLNYQNDTLKEIKEAVKP